MLKKGGTDRQKRKRGSSGLNSRVHEIGSRVSAADVVATRHLDQSSIARSSHIIEAQDVMTLNVDGALAPEFDRSRRTTSISIEGDRLHFRSAAEPSPTGAFQAHLVWKRAR